VPVDFIKEMDREEVELYRRLLTVFELSQPPYFMGNG
jgi:hypothetical protein